jgi:hypothetical protein
MPATVQIRSSYLLVCFLKTYRLKYIKLILPVVLFKKGKDIPVTGHEGP